MTIQLSPRQIMNRIYKDICGFEIPKADELEVRKSKGSPVYGEINQPSLTKLFKYLSLTNDDVLFDLGSGVGKVVIQAALFTPVKKSVGIELSETRHQEAIVAREKAQIFAPNIIQRCVLLNEDLLTCDLREASVIYTCSTAFSLGFMKKVTDRLAHLNQSFRLVTLQELPISRTFKLIDTLKLNMSWIRNTPVYIYQHK